MQLRSREVVVLMSLAVIFCVAFQIQPEWYVPEAHLVCDGEPARIFDLMVACAVGQLLAVHVCARGTPGLTSFGFVFYL